MKRFFVLFSAFLILFLSGCPQQVDVPAAINTAGSGSQEDNSQNPSDNKSIKSDAFFWGEWTRMDNGKSFVVEEDKVVYDSRNYKVNTSDSESLSVEGLGTFKKESDSVMVCSSIPYFRNGGTNLEYRLRLVGFSSSVNSMRAAGLGLQGIKGSGRSKIYTSYESKAESDVNGDIRFKAPTINDIQTVTIENNGNNVVVSNLKIQNSGDFMGTVALVEKNQYNLKITGEIEEEKKSNGYLYAGKETSYPMTITITNISDIMCSSSVCSISAKDEFIHLNSSTNLAAFTISTLAPQATKTIQINISSDAIEQPYIDTGIDIKIQNAKSGTEWNDFIPLRIFKGSIPITIAAKSPEDNNNAALNGFIIYPDGNNRFFSVKNSHMEVLYVPTFMPDTKYKMIFSGATVTSELSDSTEMYYTVNPGSNVRKDVVLITDDPSELIGYMNFGDDNHSEQNAYKVDEAFQAYLSQGEIDYYEISANIEFDSDGNDSTDFDNDDSSDLNNDNSSTSNDNTRILDIFFVLNNEGREYTWFGRPRTEESFYGTQLVGEYLCNPVCEGYTFAGWYYDKELTNMSVGQIFESTENHTTFYAKWVKKTSYNVTYELNGGNFWEPAEGMQKWVTRNVNEVYIPYENLYYPDDQNKRFAGWYFTSDFSGERVTQIEAGTHKEDITLYAKWETVYAVNYSYGSKLDPSHFSNPNGPYIVGQDLVLLDPVVKGSYSEKYVFDGWYLNNKTKIDKIILDYFDLNSSSIEISVCARFVPKFTITYDLGAYSSFSDNPSISDQPVLYNPEKDGTIVLPKPVLRKGSDYGYTDNYYDDNYAFYGWYVGNKKVEAITSDLFSENTRNITVVAQYTSKYKFIYRSDYGIPPNPVQLTGGRNFTQDELPVLEDDNYIFQGWYSERGSLVTTDSSVDSAGNFPGEAVLTARWRKKYIITYVSAYNQPEAIYKNESGVFTDDELPRLSGGEKGYVFAGWYKDAGFKVNTEYIVTGDMTLYAKWTAENYFITYELDGKGENSTENPAVYNIESDDIVLKPASGINYVFGGWYDNSSCTGTPVTKIDKRSYGNMTLYAKWTTENYFITYELDGKGENSAENPVVYNIDSQDIVLKPAASSDYGFGGWYDNSSFTGTPITNISNGSCGNRTFYARWLAKRNITYISSYGTQPAVVTVVDETVLSEAYLPELIDSAYIFMGWYKEETYTNKVENGNVTANADITLYAKWLKKCNITYVSKYKQPTALNTVEGTVFSSEELPALTEEGYVLKGWYRESDFTTKVSIGDAVTGNMTLYAKWEINDGFVYVQGGSFMVERLSGSGYTGELPTHKVTLSGFYMSPYEMTQKIYTEVMETNPSSFSSRPASGEIQEERPVDQVSWYDAIYFCNKYSEKLGLTPCYKVNGSSNVDSWRYTPHTGNSISGTITCDFKADGYRLPTEAEWEYAAKDGMNKNSYSGSAWYDTNFTHQVGKTAANKLGLYDMIGNIGEWCWDWYGSYTSSAQTDPTGGSSGTTRVWRGGFWGSNADGVGVAERYSRNPTIGDNLGFRLVRSSSNQ